MINQEFILDLKDISLEKNKLNYETIFSLSNGYIGTRGNNDEDYLNNSLSDQGTFLNGFFESEPIIYGESAYGYAENSQTIVRVPNFKQLSFSYNDISFVEGEITNEDYFLDMQTGILHRNYTWCSENGDSLLIEMERFVSLVRKNYTLTQYKITPLKGNGKIVVNGNFSADTSNLVDDDDPRKAKSINHSVITKVKKRADDTRYLETTTTHSKLGILSELTVFSETKKLPVTIQDYDLGYCYSFEKQVYQNQPIEFNLQVYYSDVYVSSELPKMLTTKQLDFLEEKEAQKKYWTDFWDIADIKVFGDSQLQKGIRHNLFHLNQAAGRNGKTNISAKGITSDGYEGHYFWDTEMYMLPFFIYTQPNVAKNLLMFRYNILDKARSRARQLGISKGVLFPWRTIDGNECSAYYPAGTAQVHINGDIAYAIQSYVDITKDRKFMIQYGAEMLVEIARFWLEFGCLKNEEFLINGVTGPDEYTALVNNNYYTNKLAKYNLECAVKAMKEYNLMEKLEVTESELISWEKAANCMRLPFDEENLLTLQDDAMNTREIWPYQGKSPLLLHYHPMMIYRYQVNKQADTILSQYLFEHDFSKEQLVRDYEYYEQITTHDSSLSRSIFSILATRINKMDAAYNYFMDTVDMDLADIQGNTIDGIHAANLGGMWLSLIKGFGGVSIKNDKLYLNPCLPKKWSQLEFKIIYQNRLLKVVVSPKNVTLNLIDGDNIEIKINNVDFLLEEVLTVNL